MKTYIVDIDDTIFAVSTTLCDYLEITPTRHVSTFTEEELAAVTPEVWRSCRLGKYFPLFLGLASQNNVLWTALIRSQHEALAKYVLLISTLGLSLPYMPREDGFTTFANESGIILITANKAEYGLFPKDRRLLITDDIDGVIQGLKNLL